MIKMCDLYKIFGKGAWPMIDRESSIEIFNVDYDQLKCNIVVGGDEYTLYRIGVRRWLIYDVGRKWELGSQWEVLAWIGDRL